MLAGKEAVATVAVKDIQAARRFYEDKLGLEPVAEEGPDAVSYGKGASSLFVYESNFAGTNKATAVTWVVDDVETEANALKAKGVAFEHYDFPDAKLQGDVHVMDGMTAAWFKDPDGNIHGMFNR